MNKRKKTLVFDPECPFMVAKAISEALAQLGFSERIKAARWALEDRGLDYPVKIQGGATHP